MRRLTAALAAALAVAVAGCGEDDGEEASKKPSGAAGGCRDIQQPRPRADAKLRRPRGKLDPARTYEVVLDTTCGRIGITLDVKTSPNTTASFASLVRKRFFDGTVFHRIVPGFVIQGGDPSASGSGGPGYSTIDKPPGDTVYGTGSVAMAKTGEEPPGTAGSQFYIVTGDASALPPDYALLGRVTSGLEAAQRIERLGDPQSGELGTPLRPVAIERAIVDVS
jgi:peptidyl-prolyl cis-trans isomerase B (cyclophilin B)